MDARFAGEDLRGVDWAGMVLCEASLAGADLTGADLTDADLRGADLSNAALDGAYLAGARLDGANLFGADLSGATLEGATLENTTLRETNIARAQMPIPIARLDVGGQSVCMRETHTSIGCETHENAQWLAWGPDAPEIEDMGAKMAAWWAQYGPAVKAVIAAVRGEETR